MAAISSTYTLDVRGYVASLEKAIAALGSAEQKLNKFGEESGKGTEKATVGAQKASAAFAKLNGLLSATGSASGFMGMVGSIGAKLEGVAEKAKKAPGAGGMLAGVAGAAGVALSAVNSLWNSMSEGLNTVMDLGGSLNSLSLQTGESAGDLLILQQAFKNVGMDGGAVGDTLTKFQDKLADLKNGSETTERALKKLKLDGSELKGMTGLQQMEAISKGMRGLESQSDRAQAALDLFGGQDGKMLRILGDEGALDTATKQAGALAKVMDSNAASFDAAGSALGALKLNSQEFYAGALSQFAPTLENIANKLQGVDFTGIGKVVGSVVGMLMQLVSALAEISAALGDVINKGLEALGINAEAGGESGKSAPGRNFLRGGGGGGGGSKEITSNLQKLGGGGYMRGLGVSSSDSMVSETRSQTGLLRRIANAVEREGARPGGRTLEPLEV